MGCGSSVTKKSTENENRSEEAQSDQCDSEDKSPKAEAVKPPVVDSTDLEVVPLNSIAPSVRFEENAKKQHQNDSTNQRSVKQKPDSEILSYEILDVETESGKPRAESEEPLFDPQIPVDASYLRLINKLDQSVNKEDSEFASIIPTSDMERSSYLPDENLSHIDEDKKVLKETKVHHRSESSKENIPPATSTNLKSHKTKNAFDIEKFRNFNQTARIPSKTEMLFTQSTYHANEANESKLSSSLHNIDRISSSISPRHVIDKSILSQDDDSTNMAIEISGRDSILSTRDSILSTHSHTENLDLDDNLDIDDEALMESILDTI